MNEFDFLTDHQLQMSAERVNVILKDFYPQPQLIPVYEEMRAELVRRYSYLEIEKIP